MVDHFHEQVLAAGKIGGHARAMVVSSGIARAIQYFRAFNAYLAERKSPYQAIVAFSGEHEVDGEKVSEASLNGRADPVAREPRAPAEARLLRARLPEQQRGRHPRLPGLLVGDPVQQCGVGEALDLSRPSDALADQEAEIAPVPTDATGPRRNWTG